MKGIVQSGGTASLHITEGPEPGRTIEPIAGAQVTLFDSASSTPIGPVATDAKGFFTINPSTTSTSGIFYATADLGDGVILMAIIGRELPDSITINELTTVSACWCAAQFLQPPGIAGDALRLRIAAAMNANIVNVVDGTSSPVLSSSPNGTETHALGVTRSLANFLASVVRGPVDFLDELFKLAGVPESLPANSPERTTIAALGNIARSPARNVGGIYIQSKAVMCYQPPVQQQPDAWTIVVKVNNSGDDDNMFGGPGNVAFDARGRAWIGNNVIQGKPDSSPVSIVLDPAGHPALNDSGQRMSPFMGGGLLGAGFGAIVDKSQRVWIGDFGWTDTTLPPGSVSLFDENAVALSDSDGFTAGVYRVQGMAFDQAGNLWIASWGNGTVVVYPNAENATSNPGQFFSWAPGGTFQPFGVAIAGDGTAWVTDSNAVGGIVHLSFSSSAGINLLYEKKIGKVMKGVLIDSAGNVWAASGGDDHVYQFDADGTLIGGYQGGGTWGPWGICLDGADNVWVGNFGPLEPGSVFHGRLTQLAGRNAAQYGRLVGDGLTPQTGYTLPTAGSEVTLHDGTKLYGVEGPECYIPMMRTTGLGVDAAGNVWTCNNWKPDFDIDVGDPKTKKPGNPGGDGMLIWVGLAAPMTY